MRACSWLVVILQNAYEPTLASECRLVELDGRAASMEEVCDGCSNWLTTETGEWLTGGHSETNTVFRHVADGRCDAAGEGWRMHVDEWQNGADECRALLSGEVECPSLPGCRYLVEVEPPND